MSEVILKKSINENALKESEEYGRLLYNENENYREIANLMEHPEFKKFYNKHFTDWHGIKTIMIFLKLYEEIEKRSATQLNGYQKLYILDKIIKDSKMRAAVCQTFNGSEKNNGITNVI